MTQPGKVRSELMQCVEALRALRHHSTLEEIDQALDDAAFHLRELKGARRCDPNQIGVLENLMRRAMKLLEEHEQSMREGGAR